MSTVAEIEAVLPNLNSEELLRLEAALRRVQQERKTGVIYDDEYGVWTEEDQLSAAAEAWGAMEAGTASRQTPQP